MAGRRSRDVVPFQIEFESKPTADAIGLGLSVRVRRKEREPPHSQPEPLKDETGPNKVREAVGREGLGIGCFKYVKSQMFIKYPRGKVE